MVEKRKETGMAEMWLRGRTFHAAGGMNSALFGMSSSFLCTSSSFFCTFSAACLGMTLDIRLKNGFLREGILVIITHFLRKH